MTVKMYVPKFSGLHGGTGKLDSVLAPFLKKLEKLRISNSLIFFLVGGYNVE